MTRGLRLRSQRSPFAVIGEIEKFSTMEESKDGAR